MTSEQLLEKGLAAKRESKYVEFKERFDPDETADWCNLVKELVAFANTKGGIVLIGLDNLGKPTGASVVAARAIDPAQITDKVKKYTGYEFTEFEMIECRKGRRNLLAITVQTAEYPIIFQKPGTYPIPGGRQNTEFSQGTIYFRHGSKSEPGNREDIRAFIDRKLETIREEWIGKVRKVVQAEPGSAIAVIPREVIQSDAATAPPIRISDDPDAPVYRLQVPDSAYPHRQTEVIDAVDERLPKGAEVNSYDILSVRRVHDINGRSEFAYNPKFGSPQYSDAFIDWIIKQYKKDPKFFETAKEKYRKMK